MIVTIHVVAMEAAAAAVIVTKVIMATVVLAVIVIPVLMMIALMIITTKMMKMIRKRTLRVLMITQVIIMGIQKQLGDYVWSESQTQQTTRVCAPVTKVCSTLTRGWLGLSIVHLGDRDVPNAFFFIDKYSQMPRISGPSLPLWSASTHSLQTPAQQRLWQSTAGPKEQSSASSETTSDTGLTVREAMAAPALMDISQVRGTGAAS